jgi:hypothetical protein
VVVVQQRCPVVEAGYCYFLVGTNNLSSNRDSCAIDSGLDRIVQSLNKIRSTPRILMIEVLPRGADFPFKKIDRIEINGHIEGLQEELPSLHAVNVDADMIAETGAYLDDYLHLTMIGYYVLSNSLKGFFR